MAGRGASVGSMGVALTLELALVLALEARHVPVVKIPVAAAAFAEDMGVVANRPHARTAAWLEPDRSWPLEAEETLDRWC